MDVETKIDLIRRPPTEEIITEEELRQLLETKEHPIAYNGWEPSGLVHLGTGLMCAYKMKDLIEAGVRFKAYLASWHALINNKLDGDLEKIKKASKHFCHAWLALGVPENKIEFIFADELYQDSEFWRRMILVAKKLTLARTRRTLEIMGRKEAEGQYVSDFIYTPMQVADIFHMEVDICQLGMDQRKANVVAREVSGNGMIQGLKFWKPVLVHHHLLQGLTKPSVWPIAKGKEREALVSAKMSKSKPNTCIWIYDEPKAIKEKISNAFCPDKIVEYNPVMEICKHIIFRELKTFEIERPQKYGGLIEFHTFEDLAKVYTEKELHPSDLKNSVSEALIKILEPVRVYFEKNEEAKQLLEFMKNVKVTR